jgi:murein DD-endopeptidase MepM/ murein hydrolase activator NlpD
VLRVLVVVLAALSIGGSAGGPSAGPIGRSGAGSATVAGVGATDTAVSYAAPVSPTRVVRPFIAPASEFGPGHRGVDLATTRGMAVGAAGAGVVTFAGNVAGRGVVVVAHADGVSTEYEPVRPTVLAGTAVDRGQVLGRVSGTHGGCTRGSCLHWGARRSGTYFDPMLLLQPLGPVRLLPWTGAA